MGRQKQTKPLQRAPSSQVMQNEAELSEKQMNGVAKHTDVNGSASPIKVPVSESSAESPGLMQLLICVLGIYAAL